MKRKFEFTTDQYNAKHLIHLINSFSYIGFKLETNNTYYQFSRNIETIKDECYITAFLIKENKAIEPAPEPFKQLK